MLDINQIINDRERVEAALRKRVDQINFTELLGWHEKRKALGTLIDAKRHERNTLSAKMPKLMAQNEDVSALKQHVNRLGEEITEEEGAYKDYTDKIQQFLSYLPNIPEEIVPAGGKENNEPLEYYGTKPEFDFEPRDHVGLATSLRLVDFERGVKIGGRGKWVYWGDGALLEWALINFFIDQHRRNGYTFVLPPHILKAESGYVAGQFPKFKDDVFYVTSQGAGQEPLTHFLLPTAETAIANLYADELIAADQLPVRLYAYTPCYRREAGAYRTAERGTIRGNQFNKVELFVIAHPDDSEQQFQAIVGQVRSIMEALGLHHRLTRLAARDCSESMAKTYDIEVWLPSINDYKEVSSVSTAHTYQAIRGNIKFKDKVSRKNRYVHTLNGSGLATSRVLPAILEQYQQGDGRVLIPEVLRPYMGKEFLAPPE